MGRYFLFKLAFSIFILLPPLHYSTVYADFSKDDFLWIEFEMVSLGENSSVTQPLIINYGIFPSKIKNIRELDAIEAFYTFGQKDKTGKDIFYKLDINVKENSSAVFINSTKITWCMVLVRGIKRNNNFEYNYLAKASFFIFGHGIMAKYDKPITIENKPAFDIRIFRERMKDKFNYERERWFPIRADIRFNNYPFRNKEVSIINLSGRSEKIILDNNGNLVYIPKYNDTSLLGRKTQFDYDLITAEYILGNKIYRCSYTILFKHFNKGRKYFDIKTGIAIFTLTAFVTFFALSKMKRKTSA